MLQVLPDNSTSAPPRKRMNRHTQAVWRFIVKYQKAHGIPPTQREIMDALGLVTMSVRRHLALLEQDGIIERTPRQARSMRVMRQPLEVAQPRYHVMVQTPAGAQQLDEDGLPYWDACRLLNDSVPRYAQRQDILYATAGDETIIVRRFDPATRQLCEAATLYLVGVQS